MNVKKLFAVSLLGLAGACGDPRVQESQTNGVLPPAYDWYCVDEENVDYLKRKAAKACEVTGDESQQCMNKKVVNYVEVHNDNASILRASIDREPCSPSTGVFPKNWRHEELPSDFPRSVFDYFD